MKKTLILCMAALIVFTLLAGCNNTKVPDEPFPTFTNGPTDPTYDTVRWESILTYKEYLDMTTQERVDFSNSFENAADFHTWYAAVKAAYDAEREENQLGINGSLDMNDINKK